jgi:phage gp37-like protein
MSRLVALEAGLIDRLRSGLPREIVPTIEGAPHQLTLDEMKRVFRQAPAIAVAFLGFDALTGLRPARTKTHWGVFVAIGNSAGEKARRHGDALGLGAWALVESATALLNGYATDDFDAIAVASCEPLASEDFARVGLTVYAIRLDIGTDLAPEIDPDDLADLKVVHVNWDVPPPIEPQPAELPADAVADATDHIVLRT